MAIAFDAATESGNKGAVSSFTFSHTCTGSDRGLLVHVGAYDNAARTVTSVTYNSVSLTQISRVTGPTTGSWTEIWKLANPASGSNTVSVTLSGAAAYNVFGAAQSFTGVDQTTSTMTSGGKTAAGNSSSQSATVTGTTANNWIVDALTSFFGWAQSVGSGQTARYNTYYTGANYNNMCGSTEVSGGGDVVMSWTSTGAHEWALIGVELVVASAGPTGPPKNTLLLGGVGI